MDEVKINKIVEDFKNIEKQDKVYARKLLFIVKKFILPIYKCRLLVEETRELEEIYLRYVDPGLFYQYSFFQEHRKFYDNFLDKVIENIQNIFEKENFYFEYQKRVKSTLSTMNKIIKKGGLIYDRFGIRLIYDIDVKSQYQFAWWIVLKISNLFKIIKTKDYLANPRQTGYSSIHIIVETDTLPVEIQIISQYDLKIKLPHFKYKPILSEYNLFIEKDSLTAIDKIMEDFKKFEGCHS